MKQNNELSLEELATLVQRLQNRVAELEARLGELHDTRPVPEEDLMVIAAAASAYLGYRGEVRAIRRASRTGWSAAGRRGRTANGARGNMPRAY